MNSTMLEGVVLLDLFVALWYYTWLAGVVELFCGFPQMLCHICCTKLWLHRILTSQGLYLIMPMLHTDSVKLWT